MEIIEMFLTPNKYSRPQIKLEKVNGVVIHYVGNPGSTALANRNYFESNKDRQVYASSHYIVGLDGEIIQCIPEDEIAYCSNNRNIDTIGIECCHENADGKFNDKTLESLSYLLTILIKRYSLSVDDILRHYDITGKKCPIYYVNNVGEWEEFKSNLFNYNENLEIINDLYDLNIISNKGYWLEAINDIKYLDILLKNAIDKIEAKNKIDIEEAIDILLENGVITNKDYWVENINNYKYLDVLFINIAIALK